MTRKENFIRAMRGEKTEFLPSYSRDVEYFTPSALQDPNGELYGRFYEGLEKGVPLQELKKIRVKDGFGNLWMIDEYGAITVPGSYVMTDLENWREKFTIPDLKGYDWSQVEKEYAMTDPEKVQELVITGPFMQLVNAMGFENALVSLIDEEEETKDFFDAIVSFLEEVIVETLKRVPVQAFQLFEDIANASSLLMSPEAYRRIIKPYEKRLIEAARSVVKDIPCEIHCCGYCQDIIDDFVEIGCSMWQPAQPCNDLVRIKERLGNKLIYVGAWDNVSICKDMTLTEEDVKESVRKTVESFGKDGGYIFWDGGAVGFSEHMTKVLSWVAEEVENW